MAKNVRLSTIAYKPVEPGDNWRERTCDKIAADLELAAQAQPDLVALPECCNRMGAPADEKGMKPSSSRMINSGS